MTYSAVICSTIGWPWVFYIYGIIAILWSFVWIFYFENDPSEMKSINQKELDFIKKDLNQNNSNISLKQIPWIKELCHLTWIQSLIPVVLQS